MFEFYKQIQDELNAVDTVIKQAVINHSQSDIDAIGDHILQEKGKQIRPASCLLAYRLFQPNNAIPESVIEVAAAIELIHMASLIHDDIIDQAPLRHNIQTIHTKWNTNVAITMGVYFYSLALELLTKANSIAIIQTISQAVNQLCVGELTQVFERHNYEMSISQYQAIIYQKTAALFESACCIGAQLAGANADQQASLGHFGQSLGYGFQIIDDYMDIMSQNDMLHKKIGQDAEVGDLTLPFILYLKTASSVEKEAMVGALKSNDRDKLRQLKLQLKTSSAISETKRMAIDYLSKAKNEIQRHESQYQASFVEIIDYIRKRAF